MNCRSVFQPHRHPAVIFRAQIYHSSWADFSGGTQTGMQAMKLPQFLGTLAPAVDKAALRGVVGPQSRPTVDPKLQFRAELWTEQYSLGRTNTLSHPDDLPLEVDVTDVKGKNFTDTQSQNRCHQKYGAERFGRSGNDLSDVLYPAR